MQCRPATSKLACTVTGIGKHFLHALEDCYPLRSLASCCRLGNAESLLRLAIWHGELRTLQRVLMAAGPHGRAALLDICMRLKAGETFAATEAECTRPTHPDLERAHATTGTESGGAAGEGAADSRNTQEGHPANGSLTEEQRCQFLYRCQVAMQLPDEAGGLLHNIIIITLL